MIGHLLSCRISEPCLRPLTKSCEAGFFSYIYLVAVIYDHCAQLITQSLHHDDLEDVNSFIEEYKNQEEEKKKQQAKISMQK